MGKRTRDQIIGEVIECMEGKELSVNEIATDVKANWSTINSTLELLKKLKIVKETITTPKIRLFKLTGKKLKF